MSILVICGDDRAYLPAHHRYRGASLAQDSNIVNLHNWSQGSFRRDIIMWLRHWWCRLRWRHPFTFLPPWPPYQMGARKRWRPQREANAGSLLGSAGAAIQPAGGLRHRPLRGLTSGGIAVLHLSSSHSVPYAAGVLLMVRFSALFCDLLARSLFVPRSCPSLGH